MTLQRASPIVAQYEYTEAEAVRSVKAVTDAVMPVLRVAPWFGAALIISIAVVCVYYRRSPADEIFLFIIALVALTNRWLVSYQAKRNYRQSKGQGKTVVWKITAENLMNETEGAAGTFVWNTLHQVKEVRDGFLLFPQPRLAHWIPKHAFVSAEDMEAFRELIRHSGVKHGGCALGPGEVPQPGPRFRWVAIVAMGIGIIGMFVANLRDTGDIVLAIEAAILPLFVAGFFILLGSISRRTRNPLARAKVLFWNGGVFTLAAAMLLFSSR